MALKRLTTGEMISLTATCVQEGHADRVILLGVPEIAALVPKLDQAHKGLLGTQVDGPSPRASAIQNEQKVNRSNEFINQ